MVGRGLGHEMQKGGEGVVGSGQIKKKTGVKGRLEVHLRFVPRWTDERIIGWWCTFVFVYLLIIIFFLVFI